MTHNYSREQLCAMLGGVGEDVHIHSTVLFFNPKKVYIGSHVRIDCYSVLSAGEEGICISDYIHIGAGTHFFGSGGKIICEDYSNISSRVSLFTSNDDYKEGFMTNPMIPMGFKNVEVGSITISKHAVVGCGSVILPKVILHLGAAVGALSLVKKSVEEFQIVGGIPAKILGVRDRRCIDLEQDFRGL